jgi:hypothetical protein
VSEDRKKHISYTQALTIDSRRSRKREVKFLQSLRKRHFRINQHLESGELAAVQAEVHGTHFDRRCIIGQELVVSGVEGKKGYLREPSLVLPPELDFVQKM